ncbi:MAG: KpsF/GutQ family sugar-phosphate isomerase [Ottowia sp.]|nr:KpsF/GutQ family sugar-phosphate isomerase [Ottowia sp.]
MITNFNKAQALEFARDTLRIEAEAILELHARLQTDAMASAVTQALSILLNCNGRVVVSGMGKSGHIARKLAATFASTGTPAFFVHPAEASHGDLGMVVQSDVFIALSNSGETAELLAILPLIKRTGAQLITLTGQPESSLAKLADVHLNVGVAMEACPLNLAPTASTTATLALGDALAVALLNARGFSVEDFARSHPGGALGRKLLTHVRDVMRQGDDIPRTHHGATVAQAMLEMTAKRMGMTVIVDDHGCAEGIFTDGDLRRLLEQGQDFRAAELTEVMTKTPHSIAPQYLAVQAVELMERYRINQLIVTDENGLLIGALNMHDLLNAQVV